MYVTYEDTMTFLYCFSFLHIKTDIVIKLIFVSYLILFVQPLVKVAQAIASALYS